MNRCIMHIDMDAFYASVEQRDNPAIRGLPVIVGGLSGRGVVSTASYEARRFGVHSAMPMSTARKLCPQGVYLVPNHSHYQAISNEIMDVFKSYSPVIQPLSIDEAFLDLSGMQLIISNPKDWAVKLKNEIKAKTGLTASVGIASNKYLAKLASDFDKPDGITIIKDEDVATILEPLSVRKLFGIGKTTAEALKNYGINTIGDLKRTDFKVLEKVLGNQTQHFLNLAHGLDDRIVSIAASKSIGKEITFEEDIFSQEDAHLTFLQLAQQTGWRLRSDGFCGQTMNIKVRFASFKTITRSTSSSYYFYHDEDIYKTALQLSKEVNWSSGIRLIGVSVSKLLAVKDCPITLDFDDNKERMQRQTSVIDQLKNRFGETIINRGLTKYEED